MIDGFSLGVGILNFIAGCFILYRIEDLSGIIGSILIILAIVNFVLGILNFSWAFK